MAQSNATATGGKNGIILVDLYHNISEYIRLNLLIAKYLNYRFGGSIIGVTQQGSSSHSIIPPTNGQNLQRLAYSFGVTEILTIDIDEEECLLRGNDLSSNITDDSPAGIRQALRSYISPLGLPLGKYAYENYLRSQLKETVNQLDGALIYSINEAFRVEKFFSQFFRERKCSWVVSGHVVYNFWAIMCHLALLADVRVAHCHPLTPELLYVLKDKPQQSMPVQSLCRAADTQESLQ